MNSRDEAIKRWLAEHRPNLLPQLPQWFRNDAIYTLMAIGFEAGREFQHRQPDAELDDPSIY